MWSWALTGCCLFYPKENINSANRRVPCAVSNMSINFYSSILPIATTRIPWRPKQWSRDASSRYALPHHHPLVEDLEDLRIGGSWGSSSRLTSLALPHSAPQRLQPSTGAAFLGRRAPPHCTLHSVLSSCGSSSELLTPKIFSTYLTLSWIFWL